ncbi:cardiolipin synthase [Vibrio scophthalmi]|uniref:Cardiolipin synthase A n=2 Tax=Vibrio scophthalmi TaxID=45658 RepID=A0A1B1NQ87_9VIBR|nr:cardiolipin synthase [Vibrio scophthalmi]ANS85801.1 Cardiolipin synthase [Vibrio scophthalmi]ANU36061.1 Cardiolipin synthase [Vibrio scophthalmi]EGU30125.1 cardiolipin synthetase [Vibrio scophthalmi LMG 19158]MCY9803233.1 cardiolipin synthase [Vibrio scophthalmi]ODS11051.1 Cardiolipin synthase [Vibrio scophthalmi]
MEQFYHYVTLAGIVLYWILVAGVTLRVVLKRRAVSVSLAWLMVIYIIPIVGVLCYFLFGELNLGRKRADRAREMLSPFVEWFSKLSHCQAHSTENFGRHISRIDELCNNRLGLPALSGNELSLQSSPQEIMRSVIDDINQATTSIRMVFYIWHPGGMADEVANALIAAARRGVEIKLLLDSAGSPRFFRSEWLAKMEQAGIHVVQALAVSPWRIFLRRLDLRQHRKIIVIDEKVAYTGSMNMVDPAFFKQNSGVGQWIDIMVRVTGPTVNVLSAIHSWDWEVETGERSFPLMPECDVDKSSSEHPIQVVPSGPGMPEYLIYQVLTLAINQANDSVRITTPYFVPSSDLLETLKMTAQRGVNVELIIPHKNDSLMVQWASRAFYSELMEAGVKIYEFDGGLLHTKSVVIDEQFCLVGTVNMDMRSLWLNFEVTLAIDDQEFTQKMHQLQAGYIAQSHTVSLDEWRQRSIYFRFLERTFYLFNPLL